MAGTFPEGYVPVRLHATFCGSRVRETAPATRWKRKQHHVKPGLRRPGESLTNRHREATVAAPLLDSTQNAGQAASSAKNLAKE